MHSLYGPNLASSDHHLFWSIQKSVDGKKLADQSAAENHIAKFVNDKSQKFYTSYPKNAKYYRQ